MRRSKPGVKRQFFAALDAFSMLKDNKRVLLALSGGKDSVCLFHLFRKHADALGVELLAAHVNHGLRGKEALRDRRFCARLCQKAGVPFYTFSCDVKAFSKQRGYSTEEAARILRYELLLSCARAQGAVLATAHTASDNTESVLLQLVRGGGTGALCGIDPVRADGVIRPLLFCTAAETKRYCKRHGHTYVEDKSNADPAYLRNFLRARVIPRLKEKNPALDSSFLRFSRVARMEKDALDAFCRARIEALFPQGCAGALPLNTLAALCREEKDCALLYRILSQMLASQGGRALPFERFLALRAFLGSEAQNGKYLETAGKRAFYIENGTVCVRAAPRCAPRAAALREGHQSLPEFGCEICLSMEKPEEIAANVHKLHMTAALDCATIKGNLCVRAREASDCYTVNGRSRAVKDLFSARHIPPHLRAFFPLVCDADGVVWMPGELAADRVRAGQAKKILYITLCGGAMYEALMERSRL